MDGSYAFGQYWTWISSRGKHLGCSLRHNTNGCGNGPLPLALQDLRVLIVSITVFPYCHGHISFEGLLDRHVECMGPFPLLLMYYAQGIISSLVEDLQAAATITNTLELINEVFHRIFNFGFHGILKPL